MGIERRRPCVQGVESGGPGREQAAIGVRSRLVTEALMHSTFPWKQLHSRRRTLFYKFSPLGKSSSEVNYDVREYEQYPDLTDRQRAILEPPSAGARM